MSKVILFRDISELVTCQGASQKQGRRVKADDLSVISRAAMLVDSGKIKWLGPQNKIPKEFSKAKMKEVSLGKTSVLPAFVESHTHLVFAGDRADEFERRNQGVSYQQIANEGGGILSTVKKTRAATTSQLKREAEKRVWRFLKQGVTTIECKSGYGLSLNSELKMLRVAKSLKAARIIGTFLGAHALAPEFNTYQDYLDSLAREVLPEVAKKKLARRADIFVDEGYFSLTGAREYLQMAQRLGFDITIHAEQLNRTGAARLAIALNARSADHLVQVSDEDVKDLARSQVTCVLLPGSDLYLKMKYPPARALINAGARVALATDYNPGSCPTQDLSLIGVLARLEMKMSLPEVISAYTVAAAHALGLEQSLGSLEVGKVADFVSFACEWRELFYQIGFHPVEKVWREGLQIFDASH